MSVSRRQFCQWFAGGGFLAAAYVPFASGESPVLGQGSTAAAQSGSDIGSLYPFVQKQADRSRLDLSFLRPEFGDLTTWQKRARAKVLEHLFYSPASVSPAPQLIRRTDRGDYVEEYLTFQTTPDQRVPAYVLVPKKARLPAPGIVLLHCHGGFYLWGKEKVVETDDEHPVLTDFKQQLYDGKHIATELVRQGYASSRLTCSTGESAGCCSTMIRSRFAIREG
jgi:acetyl esterase/lipase